MYCPICGWKNGEFTARCQSCGELLPARIVPPAPLQPNRGRALTIVLAATSFVSSLLLLALAATITRQDLWPRIIAGPEEVVALPTTTAEAGMQRVVATFAASGPARPGRHATINLGEVTTTGPWKFVVDQVSFVPDDSGSGWYQAIVTCSIQNAGTVSAKLLVPSTLASTLPEPRPTQTLPSFLPAPAASDQAPALAGGLRLYLVDPGNRQFGGGFGPSGASYEVVAAPGDVARLTYRFRYPTSARSPFMLRMMFPSSIGGDQFDVRLDRSGPSSGSLHVATDLPRTTKGARVIADGWAVECEGIDFGPAASPGERPVTVHLRVENLADEDRPALTDASDTQGMKRDFYVTDADGHLAYSHIDDLPGLIVRARGQHDVTVQLYTLDLPSSARPLFFTAVLNWQANQYAQFQLD